MNTVKQLLARLGYSLIALSVMGAVVLVFYTVAQMSELGLAFTAAYPFIKVFLTAMVVLYALGYVLDYPRARKVPFFIALFGVLGLTAFSLDGNLMQLGALGVVLVFIVITMPFFFPAVLLMALSLIRQFFLKMLSLLKGRSS